MKVKTLITAFIALLLHSYIGEAGAELQYSSFKNGNKSLNLSVNVAFIGRVGMDFLKGEFFYGFQGQAGIIAPWVGYNVSFKTGQKTKLY